MHIADTFLLNLHQSGFIGSAAVFIKKNTPRLAGGTLAHGDFQGELRFSAPLESPSARVSRAGEIQMGNKNTPRLAAGIFIGYLQEILHKIQVGYVIQNVVIHSPVFYKAAQGLQTFGIIGQAFSSKPGPQEQLPPFSAILL